MLLFSVCAYAERDSCTPYDGKKGEKSVRDLHRNTRREEQIEDDTPVEQMAMSVALRKVDTTRALSSVFALGFAAFAVPGSGVIECSLD